MNPMLKRKDKKSGAHCHILVAKTAQGICRDLFDKLMHQDDLFVKWKSHFPEGTPTRILEDEFVKKNWGDCIPAARATLTTLLTQPINDVLKEEISEALILDKTLMKGRANSSTILGAK